MGSMMIMMGSYLFVDDGGERLDLYRPYLLMVMVIGSVAVAGGSGHGHGHGHGASAIGRQVNVAKMAGTGRLVQMAGSIVG